jgi:fatty acid desaturase
VYDHHHLTHHRALGTPHDTESYKHGIDTWLRRALFATPAMLVQHLLMLRRRSAAAAGSDRGQARSERTAFESRVRWAILAAVAITAGLDYRLVLFGYIVPFVFVLPVLNTVRIVLEHYDLDRSNPFWVGTFYRTGPVTRIMFWWIGGDCHVVHHFYATIPWYRLPRAIRLIRPILLRHGVFEHRSLARLLLDWFSARRPHWSVPAAAEALPDPRAAAVTAPPS